MKRLLVCTTCLLLLPLFASADVWKWTDAKGKVHYVESDRTIFTWVESDRVFYSDSPDHEDAVAVVLVWHSTGRIEDLEQGGSKLEATDDMPEKSPEQLAAEAHYCKRVREIYDAYVNAPKLYQSKEGQREYLDDKATEAKIAETKAKLDKHCN
ncbi:MAG: DUF4124 domain-containing protein [Woeseiaceae bacterium]|nr:DUF4124 domain-containing protein [Woeseiaceae bacterium]